MSDSPGPRPALREALCEVLPAPVPAFRDRIAALADRGVVDLADDVLDSPDALSTSDAPDSSDRLETAEMFEPPEAFAVPSVVAAEPPGGVLTDRTRRLVWKARVLDDAPLGVTLAGPAYHDNPVVYATRTLREMTGYSLTDLHGENLRLLQGPETEASAVDSLRDALRAWDPITVELTNYRADGTPFRNRVSLVPVAAPDGTVDHWFGVQAPLPPD